MALSEDDRKELATIVESEGFDYAFRDYSNFSTIKDKRFHELRKAYKEAGKRLEAYLDLDSVVFDEEE